MTRSVYEAATNSCLPSPVVAGFADPGEHQACCSAGELCPACRLFGVIHGDETHARGRVAFSDAMLVKGALEQKTVQLAELSSPKPRHVEIYGKHGRRGDPIAGRKLYYHHTPRTGVPPGPRSRASDLSELAPPGTVFRFTVSFQNLEKQELANLCHCLLLEPGLGHKLGMAKPLGFGSCTVRFREAECRVYCAGDRYQRWRAPSLVLSDLHLEPGSFPEALREMLRLDKQQGRVVGYLGYRGYQGVRLGADGEFVYRQKPAPPAQQAGTSRASVCWRQRFKTPMRRQAARRGEQGSVVSLLFTGESSVAAAKLARELDDQAEFDPPWREIEGPAMKVDDMLDPQDSRKLVRRYLERLLDRGVKHEQIFVDTTGGTAPMSIGAFQAAEEMGISSIYLKGLMSEGERRGVILDPEDPAQGEPRFMSDHTGST